MHESRLSTMHSPFQNSYNLNNDTVKSDPWPASCVLRTPPTLNLLKFDSPLGSKAKTDFFDSRDILLRYESYPISGNNMREVILILFQVKGCLKDYQSIILTARTFRPITLYIGSGLQI